jgi:hypothetical protein
MDYLLVVCACEGCGSMFGRVARTYDECTVVEVLVGFELRKLELSNAFEERVALI